MNEWAKRIDVRPLLVMMTVLTVSPAWAQQPSPEQISAIRSSCRSDFMSRCSGVTPGGADALACLRKNLGQLTPGCQAAVNATTPKPTVATAPQLPAATPSPPPPVAAPAPAPVAAAPTTPEPAAPAAAPTAVPSSDQVAAIRAACPSDFAAHCAGVPPGGLEGLSCLQRNAAKLSAACRFAVTTRGMPAAAQPAAVPASPPQPAPAPASTAPAAAPKPAAAPVARPTAQQQAAIRAACQSDFMTRCAGVTPGGADALACLNRNAAQLSVQCRSAVGAVAAPKPTAATPPAAAAAAAPAQPTAEQQAAIRTSCRSDFMSRCSGVTPGGADALACLKRNEAQLSGACRTAVGAIGAPAPTAASNTTAASAGPTPAQQAAIKNTCRRDFMVNCRGVQPGGQDAFLCLQRNAARLSPDCRTALAAVADPAGAAGTAAAAPPPAAKPAPGLFPVRRAIRERLMGN